MKHNRIAMMAFILIQLFAGASQLKAQFRIVDEQDGKPVSGAYVFSSKGTLLCISDADGNVKLQEGMVTISNLAYEPLTVDAAKEKGTVCMKPKAYTLPEVAVGKAEYVKLSGAFRDICRNNGKTILYREGLADFYINLNSATVSINRLLDSKLSLWCLEALFECCISRDKPFHPLTPPSDLRQYAVENRQEI